MHVRVGRELADVVERQRRAVEQVHGEVAEALAQLGVRELEHVAAGADETGALRLRDVALGERPQRVELGGDASELAAQAGVVPAGGAVAGDRLGELGEVAHELHRLAARR